jgi:hypothetical protein
VNCWHCDSELIWGGDALTPDHDEVHVMVTNLICPDCEAYVEVYV